MSRRGFAGARRALGSMRGVVEARHGFPGALRTLGSLRAIVEARPGFAGARRALGSMWGVVEARHGFPGALRTLGSLRGHLGAPQLTVGPSPTSVVRRMSRGSCGGKGRARCIVRRLSHITRSPTRHLWA